MKSVTIKLTPTTINQKKVSPQEKSLADKLFKLLIFIAKKENIIEQKRQAFCEDEAFEPRQLFDGVSGHKNLLSADRLFEFLKEHPSAKESDPPIQKRTVYLFVKTWESDKDSGSLTLSDLNSILLPAEDSYLRSEVLQRPYI